MSVRLTADQFRKITLYRYTGGPRPSGVPSISLAVLGAKEYARITNRWKRFDPWNAWQNQGRPEPRPASVWTRVPAWDGGFTPWDLRKAWLRHWGQPPTPQPPPVPIEDLSLGMGWIVMAENPQKALWYPAHYGVMFTADVGVNEHGQKNYPWPSREQIAEHKRRGQRVFSWCDCHSTFPESAIAMMHELGLDGWCGEGESAPAFQRALDAGAKLVIVNMSALTEEQVARIDAKHVWVIAELYKNQDEGRYDNWRNRPVSGRLVACYDAAGEAPGGHRKPFREYLNAGLFLAHRDSVYDPGSTDDDRRLVP